MCNLPPCASTLPFWYVAQMRSGNSLLDFSGKTATGLKLSTATFSIGYNHSDEDIIWVDSCRYLPVRYRLNVAYR